MGPPVNESREPRTARRQADACPRVGNPAPEIFLWSTCRDLGRRTVLALRSLRGLPNRHPRWRHVGTTRLSPTTSGGVGVLQPAGAAYRLLRIARAWLRATGGGRSIGSFRPRVGLLGRVLLWPPCSFHYLAALRLVPASAPDRRGAARRETGPRRAILCLAVFPIRPLSQAVYSESLYLLLTLAAFARRAWAFPGAGPSPASRC